MKKGYYWLLIALLIILIMGVGGFFIWYINSEIINKSEEISTVKEIDESEKYSNETWQEEYVYWLQEIEDDQNLMVMNADGSRQTKVIEGDEKWMGGGNIQINSNNTYYAYICDKQAASLCIYNIEENELKKIDLNNQISDISWNSEGNKIIFISKDETGENSSGVIAWTKADGTDYQELNIIGEFSGNISQPVFSPDGKNILFSLTKDDGNKDLYLVNVDGSNLKSLLDGDVSESNAVYSPDGQKIAYQAGDEQSQIWTMDNNGSNQMQITQNGNNIDPNSSYDGNRIVFISDRDKDGSWEIYSMYYDGSDQVRLTSNSYNDIFPRWSPYSIVIKNEADINDAAESLDKFIIAKISGSTDEIKALVHQDYLNNMDLVNPYKNLFLSDIKGYQILSEENISENKKDYKLELIYADENLDSEVLIYSIEIFDGDWKFTDARLGDGDEETEADLISESSVTTGNIDSSTVELEQKQSAVDDGNDVWRLDPYEVAKRDGEAYGLSQYNDKFTLVSKVDIGDYSGAGEATVEVEHQNNFYIIQLIQPQKQGSEGIWVINSIVKK